MGTNAFRQSIVVTTTETGGLTGFAVDSAQTVYGTRPGPDAGPGMQKWRAASKPIRHLAEQARCFADES